MTESKYPEYVNRMFEVNLKIQRLKPVDRDSGKRHVPTPDGIASFLGLLNEHSKTYKSEQSSITESEKNQTNETDKQQTQDANEANAKLRRQLIEWNPEKDPQISGDPYKTVFIGRLDYNIDEIELNKKFSMFGEIEHVRVVRDKTSQKSKGYAFVVYKNTQDAQLAFQRGNGMIINDRKVVVDVERGRVVKNWKPRRLAGGLGGRHYTSRLKVIERTKQASVSKSGPQATTTARRTIPNGPQQPTTQEGYGYGSSSGSYRGGNSGSGGGYGSQQQSSYSHSGYYDNNRGGGSNSYDRHGGGYAGYGRSQGQGYHSYGSHGGRERRHPRY
ncbi:unnamed protein product [Ambrosiozyma monospora]|uniref:Unnamed protein product n=1 Tax=Ambrosiozyma monospora TaxID=43982 RepID=A0A9W6YMQ8_AMBMO|nr:unnamed protein product [Ambrosiozyma monospora]